MYYLNNEDVICWQEKEAAKKDLSEVQRALRGLESRDKSEISSMQKLEMWV